MRTATTYLLLALLTLPLALSGCYDTYPGLVEEPLTGEELLPPSPDSLHPLYSDHVPVSIAISNPSYSLIRRQPSDTSAAAGAPSTRAYGGFDLGRDTLFAPDGTSMSDRLWDAARFHVFGFVQAEDGAPTDFSRRRVDDPNYCLLDDEPLALRDRSSFVLNYVIDDTHDGKRFYPDSLMLERRRFDFYGYYVDDIQPVFRRTTDGIEAEITIDGSQDVLSGYARLTASQQQQMEVRDDAALMQASWYSTYTGRYNLIPVIDMRHRLTRFLFELYPGDQHSDSVFIDSICVLAPKRGVLPIASTNRARLEAGPTWERQRDTLWLRNWDNSPRLQSPDTSVVRWSRKDQPDSISLDTRYCVHWDKEYDEIELPYDRPGIRVGESLMVPPVASSDSIEFHIFATDHNNLDGDRAYEARFALNNPEGGFRAGYVYTVRVAVYGYRFVNVQAVLTGWAKGGDIFVDLTDDTFQK